MGPDSAQRLRTSSHLGWITSLFWRTWGWSDLALHNELSQVLGAVVAVCVHRLNSLHSGLVKSLWGKSMDRLLLQAGNKLYQT